MDREARFGMRSRQNGVGGWRTKWVDAVRPEEGAREEAARGKGARKEEGERRRSEEGGRREQGSEGRGRRE